MENNTLIKDTKYSMINRKNDHIRICVEENIDGNTEIFSGVRFLPEALPELNFEQITTEQVFLNRTFSMPLMLTGMTGGVEKGQEINEALALSAQKFNIPMGLGSQKMMVKNPELKYLFNVRKVAPSLFIIGNIGATSFNYGIKIDDIKRLVDDLELNAFALHVNALQECLQPEGERNFSHLLQFIEMVVKNLSIPVIVKEVGAGITSQTFQRLVLTGVSAVDVGGKGGTSWSAIEGLRSNTEGQRLGELFRNWGIATDEAISTCATVKKQFNYPTALIATGGIRNGLQVAKAVALGASMAGVGLPLFRAAASPGAGETALEAVEKELLFFKKSLEITMFCTGSQNLSHLSSRIDVKV